MKLEWSVIWEHRQLFFDGVLVTIGLTITTMLIAVPAGMALAMMRLSQHRIFSSFSFAFVEFFRNVPLILVVYWAFYVMPIFLNIEFSAFATGLVALSLNVSAYNAETFRSGIHSIRKGQTMAGLALGMSQFQIFKSIILPQATRRILPILASTWVSLFKDTSLVSVISVGDLAHNALMIRSQTFRVLEVLTAMAGIYWLLGYPQAKLAEWVKRKFEVKE